MKLSTQPSALCTLLFALCTSLSALAAVPLRWTVETSRVQPVQFEAFRGETLELKADLFNYGKPLSLPSSASLYWQTNGMGTAYWSAPATVESNRLSAVWLPTYDTGARAYNCFLGCSGDVYRAAFQLRLRDSPGAAPNALPLPRQVIDFSRIEVLNPPWSTVGVGGVASVNGMTGTVMIAAADIAYDHGDESDETVKTSIDRALQDALTASIYSSTIYSYMTANTNAWFASTNYLSAAEDRASRTRWTLQPDMDAATVPPSMALWERRDGAVQCVWDQRDWPTWYWQYCRRKLYDDLSKTNAAIRSELHRLDTNKMSRGWSKYTAVNGLDNPYRDTTWIDTPKIILAAGYQWETTVEASGIWVLSGNGIQMVSPTTEGEAEGSTYFKIKDFEGNAVFTVRKSDTRIVGAIPSSIRVNGTESFTVSYAVNAQPIGEFTTDLDNDFVSENDAGCPFAVTWAQSGSNYVATVTAKSGALPGAAFMRAKYEVPGETIIDNAAPVKFSNYLQFGNLKIRPVKSGGSITWEEVQ